MGEGKKRIQVDRLKKKRFELTVVKVIPRNQSTVQLTGFEHGKQLVGIRPADMDMHFRTGFFNALKCIEEKLRWTGYGIIADAQAEEAALLGFLHFIEKQVIRFQDLIHPQEELPALRIEGNMAHLPVEKGKAYFLFQGSDQPGKGRLRHVKAFCCPRKAAHLGGGLEGPQGLDGHLHICQVRTGCFSRGPVVSSLYMLSWKIRERRVSDGLAGYRYYTVSK